jgi:tetratricopeptide (TPR) repeat protein
LTDAIEHYQQAVRLEPDSSEYCYALGVALTETGRLPEAVPHFRQVLVQQPDSLPALNALAWVLATWEDATPTETVEAVELAEQAANMTNHQHPRILDTLAAAYAAKGDFQRAISTAEKAVELADTGESSELAEEIRGRLAKYRSGEPHRESSQPHKE